MSMTTTSTKESKVHDAAHNRLATLIAHLLPPSTTSSSALIQPLHLSASSRISPPLNLKGTLTIVDDRTGKKYNIEVFPDGTIKSNDFKNVMDVSALFPNWLSESSSILFFACWEGLWRKVLVARYAAEDGGLEDGGWSYSSWWREIVRIRYGRRVGDGAETYFWRDCWCGDVSFRERFHRLYDLAVQKAITVRNMFLLGWNDGGEDTSTDMWQWLLDRVGVAPFVVFMTC
ncbi:hypothetical protein MTR_3g051920 [Medicago truncatula]|uniref:Uncharacterized protein n=1 Tax=Medicago truncatula TaxID=3880 RepID=G7IY04_MEDTR|nr:hypothetical protein MTR_3g051920 [Medicago truncatula]